MKTLFTFYNILWYPGRISQLKVSGSMRRLSALAVLLVTGLLLHAQPQSTVYTSPPLLPNNGAGGITFEVSATQPIEITEILCVFSTGATTANIWMRTGGVEHSPGQVNISTANGWTQVITAAAITGADNATLIPINFGTTVIPIQPSVVYGFHIEGNTRYQTGTTSDPAFLTDGTLSVIVTDPASYGGPPPTPPNNPRRFTGAVTYQLQASGAANDAGVTMINSPTSPVAPGLHTVTATIRNYGTNVITSASVNWSVNGAAQTPFAFTGALDTIGGTGSTTSLVTLGSFNFPSGINTIKAWTSMPNNQVDTVNINDTATVSMLFINPLSGIYTVGGPTADFNNFSQIQTAFEAGLAGPVTFNFDPAYGPYNGGFEFGNILGNSFTNSITFNGNGSTITDGSPTFIIALNGVTNFTINGFNIINTNPVNNKFGIMIRGASQYVNITNNYLDLGTTSTSSLTAGIAVSGSVTSATTAGNNGQYINITDNEIVGSYYGVTLMGAASYLNCFGNTVTNNIIRDFYVYGVYLSNVDTAIVSANTITRANRAALSTFYGIYATTSRNIKYHSNEIHSSGVGSYTAYPIYITTSVNSLGYETEFINNLIYNIPTTSTVYGIYLLGTRDHIKMYHNTVALYTEASNTVRAAFYSTAPNNHDQKNNIFSVEGPGTGTKYSIYISTTSTTFTSNNNVIYMGATAGTTNYVGYWGANNTTLADWQLASSQDANSVNANPVLAFPAYGNATPLSLAIDNIGTPIGVLTDIYGNPRSTTTPDVGGIEFTGVTADLAMVGGELVSGECLSTNDSVYIKIANIVGPTVNFTTATTTVNWSVTGPVNSSGTIIINSGSLASATQLTVGGAGVNMSVPGDYFLSAYISSNAVNLFAGNDTISEMATLKIWPPFQVSPKQVLITSPADTVEIKALSTFFPAGAFFMTEICHFKTTTGAPTGGWPSWLSADDYIEITGVPNSDLGGYSLEQWTTSAMNSTFTFPQGTILSPGGTAIIAVGQASGSVESPANFYYHGTVIPGTTYSSTTATGRILKDPSGNIVDAVGYGTYTFPAAANVTAADWSGNTTSGNSGTRLIGPYTKDATNWVNSSTSPQDPNSLNSGVTLPSPQALTGFTWSYNGVVTSSNVIDTVVGPWATSGVYHYVASYITPCGVLTDTVTIIASFLGVSNDTAICLGDSAMVSISLPGTGPWALILTDGTTIDTISSIPVSSFSIYVSPTATTTYSILGYMDASMVLIPSTESITVTVIPLPTVTISDFDICEYEAAVTLTGGMPAGGTYMGTGVTAGEFDPTLAGAGSHVITYTYADANGCEASAVATVDVHAAPVVALGSDFDVCADGSAIIDAGTGFATYLWSTGATIHAITVDGSVIGLGNTVTFSVTVTDSFGCEGSDEVNVTAIDCTGLDELSDDRRLEIWPNPSNGNFTMKIAGVKGDATIRIIRSTGELVNAEHVTLPGDITREFNLDHLSSGIYFIQVITKDGIITEKLMVR